MASTWTCPEGHDVTDQLKFCPHDSRSRTTVTAPNCSAARNGGQASALDAAIRQTVSGTPPSQTQIPKPAKGGPRSILTSAVVGLLVLGAGMAGITWAVSRGGEQSDAMSNWTQANEQTFADIPSVLDTSSIADCSSLVTVISKLRGVPPPPDARLAAHLSNAIDRLNTATGECTDHQVDAFNDEIAGVNELLPLTKALQ